MISENAKAPAPWLKPECEPGLVSVIVPTFNRARLIGETLDSVFGQTYRPLEIIVVDDESEDETAAVVEAWRASHEPMSGLTLQFHQQAKGGACVARNWGLQNSRGEYIQFLDSDDLLSADKIEAQVAAARQHPDSIISGPWEWFEVRGEATWRAEPSYFVHPEGDFIAQWLDGSYWATSCLLWPRVVIEKIGPWDESLAANQDGEFLFRAVQKGHPLMHCAKGKAHYRVYVSTPGSSMGTDNTRQRALSHMRILENLWDHLLERGAQEKYRTLVARAWYYLARRSVALAPIEAEDCFARFRLLAPNERIPGTFINRVATRLLGFRRKEQLAKWFRGKPRNWRCRTLARYSRS